MRGMLIFSLVLNLVLLVLFFAEAVVVIMMMEEFRDGDMCDECCPYKVEPSRKKEDER